MSEVKWRQFEGEIILWAVRTQGSSGALQPHPRHPREARIVERTFGIGVSALAEAIEAFGEKLNVHPA